MKTQAKPCCFKETQQSQSTYIPIEDLYEVHSNLRISAALKNPIFSCFRGQKKLFFLIKMVLHMQLFSADAMYSVCKKT